MPNEIELKLRFPEAKLDSVIQTLNEQLGTELKEPKQLVNIYFDTAKLELNRYKVALRIRQKGKQFIQTLKTKGTSENGLHQRGEWEWEVKGRSLDAELLENCSAWPSDIEVSELKEAFETNFNRYATIIDFEGSQIEIAIDNGAVIANNQTETITELELELVKGDTQALLNLAAQLKSTLSLEPYDVSKAERGYALFQKK